MLHFKTYETANKSGYFALNSCKLESKQRLYNRILFAFMYILKSEANVQDPFARDIQGWQGEREKYPLAKD